MRGRLKGLVGGLAATVAFAGAAVPIAASAPAPVTSKPDLPRASAPARLGLGGGTWQWQNPQPDAESLLALSCPSTTTCYAAGLAGTIVGTTDGGAHWAQQGQVWPSPFLGLSCPDTMHCSGVGFAGQYVYTSNGGSTWNGSTVSGPAFLSGVSCSTATACVAIGAAGFVMHSSDGGASWMAGASGTTSDLNSVSCPSPSLCAAVGGGGLIITTADGGATWTGRNSTTTATLEGVACPSTTNCDAVGACPNTPNCDAAGHQGTFLFSTDGGMTWLALTNTAAPLTAVSCPDTTHCFAAGADGDVHFQNPSSSPLGDSGTPETGALFAISCPNVLVCFGAGGYGIIVATTNGGTGWSTAATQSFQLGGISCPTAATCFASGWDSTHGDRGVVEMSADGGTTWSVKLQLAQFTVLTRISCPSTSVCFAVGQGGIVQATTDGGASWTAQTSGTASYLFGVSCPSTTVCFAVGLNGTIINTTNGGTTWTAEVSNTTDELTGVSCVSLNTCFASVSSPQQAVMPVNVGHVFATHDGGAHWAVSFDPATDPSAGANAGFNAISCPSASYCYAVASSGLIAATSDGGVNWRTDNPPDSGNYGGISCPSVTVCYATDGQGVIHTSNAGGSWELGWGGIFGTSYQGIACTSATTCIAVGGAPIIRTTTGGEAWTRQRPTGVVQTIQGLACTDASNCYGVANDSFMVTHNGGVAWTSQVLSTTDNMISISCPAAGKCVAVGWPGAVYVTSDSGTTWTYQPNLLSGADETMDGVSCPTTNFCVEVGTNGNILSTSNGGATWSHESSGTTAFLLGVSCANTNSCVAVGSGGVALARAGGAWHQYPSGTTNSLRSVDCPTAPTCFAIGNNGALIKTGDGGGTWAAQTSGTTRTLRSIKCVTTTVCLAAGSGGRAVITLDGITWSDDSPPTINTLWAVAWSDLNHAWLGGSGGTILGNQGVTTGCGSVSGGALPSSPQARGPVVAITATANGCPNPIYEVWMLPPGGGWTLLSGWSKNPTYNWDSTGGATGSYHFSVWARDISSNNAFDSFFAFDFVLTVTACTGIAVTGQPSNTSVQRGQPVLFTATSTGCPNPLYEYWMLPPGGGWALAQAYSATNTFNWSTFVAAGSYRFSVWVHDASNSNAYDAFSAFPYAITSSACGGMSATSNPSGTTTVGTQVTITGVATGCPYPYYEFWLNSTGGGWQLVQGYTGANSFVWPTTGLAAGTYRFSVWAQDGTAPTSYQAFTAFDYTLTTTPCTGMGASASPVTAPTGSIVHVFGTATGCPNQQLEFWLLPPGGSWMLVRAYSPQQPFDWNTLGLAPGTYRFSVWARDASSTAPYDAFSAFDYTLTMWAPCTTVSITVTQQGPAPTIVTVTANAGGCANPRFEYWVLPPGGSWTLVQAYTDKTGIGFVARASGTYRISVWARDVSSSASYDTFSASDYIIT